MPDDTRRNGARRWCSRIATDGMVRGTHRGFMRATGLDGEAVARPMIGVVTVDGEMTACRS